METYKIKQLIAGAKVDRKFIGKTLVAVPEKNLTNGRPLFVVNGNQTMVIRPGSEYLTRLEFPNKFGPGLYALVYFEWKPERLEFGESYGEAKAKEEKIFQAGIGEEKTS